MAWNDCKAIQMGHSTWVLIGRPAKGKRQTAAYIPTWGGSPATVVENAIACGNVTIASVRPMRRLARAARTICGNALAKPSAAALIGGIVVQRLDMAAAEPVGV